jgi:hypothetical protein
MNDATNGSRDEPRLKTGLLGRGIGLFGLQINFMPAYLSWRDRLSVGGDSR